MVLGFLIPICNSFWIFIAQETKFYISVFSFDNDNNLICMIDPLQNNHNK